MESVRADFSLEWIVSSVSDRRMRERGSGWDFDIF